MRQTGTQIDRQTNNGTGRQAHRQQFGRTDRQTNSCAGRQAHRRTDNSSGGHRGRQADYTVGLVKFVPAKPTTRAA